MSGSSEENSETSSIIGVKYTPLDLKKKSGEINAQKKGNRTISKIWDLVILMADNYKFQMSGLSTEYYC
jgi:hypothetical protein